MQKKQGNTRASRSHHVTKSESMESQLMVLLENELKDIYWAEKALTKAIPKMIKKATSQDLINALENHLSETEEQVSRCEQVFELIGHKATAKKCEAMAGLINEATEIMDDTEAGPMRDAGIISAAQKVEHYEIATYGTLCTFAETLGLKEVKDLLGETLNEEKQANDKLTEIAVFDVNEQAVHQETEK